ncbi:MAG: citrate transporter, partial [Peptococcaceae bacterium]
MPPIGGLTELGMRAIGIFFGVLWGWVFIDLGWPSLLGIFAVGTTGYMTVAKSFATAFSDSQTLQMILVLALVAYLEESGCSTYLARWFVSRKVGVGRPWFFSLLIL